MIPELERLQGEITKEKLNELYNIQNKTRLEISLMYNSSVTTIQRLLNDYKITKKSTSQIQKILI